MKSEEKETGKPWTHDWITTGTVQREDSGAVQWTRIASLDKCNF